MTTYHASPASMTYAPGKWFTTALEALRYAREASATFRVGYVAWEIQAGRPKRLATFTPDDNRP